MPVQDGADSDINFDPVKLAGQIYDQVSGYRSQFSAKYDAPLIGPQGAPGEAGESQLNAFYRMLGLPAVVKYRTEDNIKFEKSVISQDQTLNYFEAASGDLFDMVSRRDLFLQQLPEERALAELWDNPPQNAKQLWAERGKLTPAKKVSIFPMVVNAAVPVFPLNRRLAPSFAKERYGLSGGIGVLSRPLIDNIIYIRFGINKGIAVPQKIEDRITSLAGEITDLDISDRILLTQYSFVEAIIITKLLLAIKKLSQEYQKLTSSIKELSSEINFVPGLVDDPNRRSELLEKLNPEKSLDREILALNAEMAVRSASSLLLPMEQIKKIDRTARAEDYDNNQNITEDVLIGTILSLMNSEVDELNRQFAEKKKKRGDKIARAERLKRALMHYTGRFDGLSIFDVICVMYALFSIEQKHLIGLLNRDARARLGEDPIFLNDKSAVSLDFALTGDDSAIPSLKDCLDALEGRVKEAYSIADSFPQQARA